ISSDGQVELHRSGELVQVGNVPTDTFRWHQVRLSAVGSAIQVEVDGLLQLTWIDTLPLPAGKIVLHGNEAGTSTFFVDNFSLSVAASENPALPSVSTQSETLNLNTELSGVTLLSANSSVAFTRYSDPGNVVNQNQDIYVLDPDNPTFQFRVTTHPADDREPALSPNGQEIAFTSDRDGDGFSEIYVINSSYATRLLTVNGASPAWSPDGQKIAFIRDGAYEIFTVDSANGGNLQQITYNSTSELTPTWSPNGQEIAFTKYDNGNYEIYTVNITSHLEQNISNYVGPDYVGSWASNGRISFTSQRTGSWDLFIRNTDGSIGRVTNNQDVEDSSDWSPDNNRLVYNISFSTVRDAGGYVINSDGTGDRLIEGNGGFYGNWSLTFPPPGPTPTPTLTLVPTPTPFTNQAYAVGGQQEAYQAVIFWVTYWETSADSSDSGSPVDADLSARHTEFLFDQQQNYCSP
ncbi:MAG: hypothetical protein K8I82_00850, partial [Anaerolineae bacterium]|nr:hypothetical protein [Anaerolineae bacterium]